VEAIELDSNKIFRFHRIAGIRDFAEKSLIPAPLVVFEHILFLGLFVKRYFSDKKVASSWDHLHLPDLDDRTRKVYTEFEMMHKARFCHEHFSESKKPID
jgi:hypothetical protein